MGKIDLAISMLKDIVAPPLPLPLPPISTSVMTGSDEKDDDENDKMIIEEEEDEEEEKEEDEEDDYESNGEEVSDDYDVDDEDLRDRLDFFEGVSEEDYVEWIKESNLEKKASRLYRIQRKQRKLAKEAKQKASSIPLPVVITSERLKNFQGQIDSLNAVKTTIGLAAESLKKKEFR